MLALLSLCTSYDCACCGGRSDIGRLHGVRPENKVIVLPLVVFHEQ